MKKQKQPFVYLSKVFASNNHTKTRIFLDSEYNIIEDKSYSFTEDTQEGGYINCYIDKQDFFSAFDLINGADIIEYHYIVVYQGFVLKFKLSNKKKLKVKFTEIVSLYDFDDTQVEKLLEQYVQKELYYFSKECNAIINDANSFLNQLTIQ